MHEIKLTATNPTEQRVLDYLTENASEVLAGKINAGKKTLAGALKYAKSEACRLPSSDGCVCVDDATVFGWVIHFFEEDHIAEPAKDKPAQRLPGGVKRTPAKTKKEPKPAPVEKPQKPDPAANQITMFDALFSGGEKK